METGKRIRPEGERTIRNYARRVFSFRGGSALPLHKDLSRDSVVEILPGPAVATVPLWQHAGVPADLVVKIGQQISMGELIGSAAANISANVHSPVSGKILDIRKSACRGGKECICVSIENDQKDTAVFFSPLDIRGSASTTEVLRRIEDAGIVGLGGAVFPARVKLEVPSGREVDTLLVNGVECEPYLTGDNRLMQEKAPDIIEGIQILMQLLKARRAVVGIEEYNHSAIESMRSAIGELSGIAICILKTKYPQGQEKMLIKAITGRTVPLGKLPVDAGVIVQNVGTVYAIYEAVTTGKPLIDRVVTVSGEAVLTPKNVLVRIGTPVREVLDHCGGCTANEVAIIAGGPMMGTALESFETPIDKGMSGIIVIPTRRIKSASRYPCINCGACSRACPMRLLPSSLAHFAERGDMDEARAGGILACCNCGLCSVLCPSHRPNAERIWQCRSRVH